MSTLDYLRIIRAHWVFIVALTAVGGIAAGAYRSYSPTRTTTEYTATAQLFIAINDDDANLGQVNPDPNFITQRVRTYLPFVDNPAVLNEVIDSLGLPYTVDEMAEKVDAESPSGTVLIDIVATDNSAQLAEDIANAAATALVGFISTIETSAGQSTSPVNARVTKRAVSVATVTSSSPGKISIPLGVAAGLAIGVGLAVLRYASDRTIRGRREIGAVTDYPVIGEIGEDTTARKRPLIADEPTSPRSEALRRLRTNVRSRAGEDSFGSVVVTAADRYAGTSTIAANLAIALAQSDVAVVLVDANLRNPCLAAFFGVPDGVGLTDVLRGEVSVEAAMHHWRQDLPLYVLTSGAGSQNPSDLLGSRRLRDVVASLVAADLTVVVDSPPLVPVTDAADVARVTHGVLLVTRVGSTRTDHLATAIEALDTVNAHVLGVVANRIKRGGATSASGIEGARSKSKPRADASTPTPSRSVAATTQTPSTAGKTVVSPGVTSIGDVRLRDPQES